MHTIYCDIELVDRLERSAEKGATWNEAPHALTDHFPLSAGSIRDVYHPRR